MLTTLFRVLNGLLLVFALPFFPWHGNGGRETTQFDLMTIQMPKKFIPMWLQANLTLLRPIAADWLQSATISECNFGLFSNLILHNCAIRLCSIQYAIKVDLDRNQLRQRQNLCIMGFMHYSPMHYSHFNCGPGYSTQEYSRGYILDDVHLQ